MRLYEIPWYVESADLCHFFHTMELPEVGLVQGLWDLRDTVDDYLGDVDYAGKRVLDVGSASGFLTFEMERRGAEVVSFDAIGWEEVPYEGYREQIEARRTELARALKLLKNGYWLAHRLHRSKAQVYYGDIYDLPDALGLFDVAVIGTVLGHLRDPMLALESICRRVRQVVVVVEGTFDDERPVGYFAPDPASGTPTNIWWSMSESCICQMLGVFGFGVTANTAYHLCNNPTPEAIQPAEAKKRSIPVTTFVGRRK